MFATLPRDIASLLPGETPALDAQVLLAHITGHSRAWVLAHPEAGLTPEQESALEPFPKLESATSLRWHEGQRVRLPYQRRRRIAGRQVPPKPRRGSRARFWRI